MGVELFIAFLYCYSFNISDIKVCVFTLFMLFRLGRGLSICLLIYWTLGICTQGLLLRYLLLLIFYFRSMLLDLQSLGGRPLVFKGPVELDGSGVVGYRAS
jgi:hypothetical protein